MYRILCPTQPLVDTGGGVTCPDGWQADVAAVPFTADAIDPAVIMQYYSSGFMISMVIWAAMWSGVQIIRSIRMMR